MKKKILLFIAFAGLLLGLQAQKVKFAVDMTGVDISAAGVFVTGDFQEEAGMGDDWEAGMVPLTQETGTNIYSIVLTLSNYTKYEYKFVNGKLFYDAEFVPEESRVGYDYNDSRWIYTGSLDTTFTYPILFAQNAPANMYLLRVKVDMERESISKSDVWVKGNFTGGSTPLYSFADTIYEGIVYASAGNINYKFYNGNTSENVPSACATSENRTVNLTADNVLDEVCFSACTSCDNVSSIQNVTKQQLTFMTFPNPGKDFVIIQTTENLNQVQCNLYDIHGKKLQTHTFSGNEYKIYRANLSTGMYYVELVNQNGQRLGYQKVVFN